MKYIFRAMILLLALINSSTTFAKETAWVKALETCLDGFNQIPFMPIQVVNYAKSFDLLKPNDWQTATATIGQNASKDGIWILNNGEAIFLEIDKIESQPNPTGMKLFARKGFARLITVKGHTPLAVSFTVGDQGSFPEIELTSEAVARERERFDKQPVITVSAVTTANDDLRTSLMKRLIPRVRSLTSVPDMQRAAGVRPETNVIPASRIEAALNACDKNLGKDEQALKDEIAKALSEIPNIQPKKSDKEERSATRS